MALGIYISVPFCRTKCSYCNFASEVFSRAAFGRYVERVCADIRDAVQIAREMGGRFEGAVDSLYLGGGTPTVLDAGQLRRIFEAVWAQFSVLRDAEITIECAPGTLTPAVIDALPECNVNRVSLGVQSFVDQEAAAVGRLHKRETVLDDIAHLRAAGITNINIDLIAGLPHQTRESWEFSVAEIIATGVPHVSVYMLEVDEDSRLGRELIAGGTRYHAHFVPDDDTVADFYLAARERLQAAGITQYEISNFARRGSESRHNLKYWTREPYLGFGVNAHSMLPASGREPNFNRVAAERQRGTGHSENIESVRFATSDSLEGYLAAETLPATPIAGSEALEEAFFLGLRLTQGVSLADIATKFGDDAISDYLPVIADLLANGFLEQDEHAVRLTERGLLLSNEVFERFILPEREAAAR